MSGTITYTVATEADLDAAIAAINLGGSASAINTSYVIAITTDLSLALDIPAINLAAGDTLTIQGANADNPNLSAVIDGGGNRGFIVTSGTVNFSDLWLVAMSAPGTSGPAGDGGALYVGAGAVVSATSVSFSGDSARLAGGAVFVAQGGSFSAAGGSLAGSGAEAGHLAVFVDRFKSLLRGIGVAIAFLVLIVWNHPTAITVLVVAIVLVVYLALLEFLGRNATGAPAVDSNSG